MHFIILILKHNFVFEFDRAKNNSHLGIIHQQLGRRVLI